VASSAAAPLQSSATSIIESMTVAAGAASPAGADQAPKDAASGLGQAAEASSQAAIRLTAGPNAPPSAAASSIDALSGKTSAAAIRVSPDAADHALAANAAASDRAARAAADGPDDPDASTAPASPSAQATAVPLSSAASINLALAEGSDATGATASALQSAQAASAAPPTPVQSPVLQNAAVPDSTQTVSPAAVAVAVPSAGLGSSGNEHDRGADSESNAGGGDAAAALQQLTSNVSTASTDAAPAPTMRVNADVDSAEFPQSLADRVSFMVDNSWSNAKLQVNPPQLGPIELQIAVQGDHAQVMMSTHSALTRDALESSVPKLREMLNSQGFTQVNVDVSQRSFQERSAYTPPYGWTPSPAGSVAPAAISSTAAPRTLLGVVDAYA
jgi:flagellar hook-length control protein FliK